MGQLLLVLLAFLTIPLLNKFGVKMGFTLIATALVASLLNRLNFAAVLKIFLDVFINASSRDVLLVVIMVSVIGKIMKDYGVLDKLVFALEDLVGDIRVLFMLIPALFGVLTIPGGALLSAPFINGLGERVNMPVERRAAVNLIFRHVATFVMPYSTSMLIVKANFPELNIYRLIGLNAAFTAGMIIIGYFLFLKKVTNPDKRPSRRSFSSLKKALLYSSPIYACVIVNMVFGIPLYITMFLSLGILYLLGPKKGFFKLVISSLKNINTIITIIGVFFIQGVIKSLPGLNGLFSDMFNSGSYAVLAIVLACVLFGLLTGLQLTPLSIILPMLAGLNLSQNELLPYLYFTCCWAFLGYYFSPLHMCQLFTCENMNVKTGALWKEYRLFMPLTAAFLAVSYFAVKAFL